MIIETPPSQGKGMLLTIYCDSCFEPILPPRDARWMDPRTHLCTDCAGPHLPAASPPIKVTAPKVIKVRRRLQAWESCAIHRVKCPSWVDHPIFSDHFGRACCYYCCDECKRGSCKDPVTGQKRSR